MVACRSKRFSTIGELFLAWDEEGREDGFLAEDEGPGVVRRAVDDIAGFEARGAAASVINRSICRGWRDEWRELEFGV